jgi:hypothetical protein
MLLSLLLGVLTVPGVPAAAAVAGFFAPDGVPAVVCVPAAEVFLLLVASLQLLEFLLVLATLLATVDCVPFLLLLAYYLLMFFLLLLASLLLMMFCCCSRPGCCSVSAVCSIPTAACSSNWFWRHYCMATADGVPFLLLLAYYLLMVFLLLLASFLLMMFPLLQASLLYGNPIRVIAGVSAAANVLISPGVHVICC